MNKGFLRTGAVIGLLSVVLGAFGAHSLKQYLSEYALNVFETGVRYQFYHAFAILVTGIMYKDFSNKFLRWAGISFIIGIILFSGSLYGIAAANALLQPRYTWLGAITPLGGSLFILGWIFLFIGTSRSK